ncbi:putative MFS transporter [Hypoxylon trugodes]|uniref:putative MFS transporter n=1 Tax=Hypoxylon trugodes TaxID=326681 RepID=UPI0021A13FA1|nr:putative MFS transporter [Hypoxylon trugodes]KAI1394168.1 putative MFS transporter [Hypoxylon trugodes]
MDATPDLSRQKSGKAEHVEQIAGEVLDKGTDAPVDRFGAHAKTDPKEIKLVKKLDMYILPILWLMYFFNFLDRNAMVNGKLDGLDKQLHMKGYEYNTCVSILFVGYLAGQVPSNMLLNRVRPSLFMAGFMTAWSITTLCTFLVHDYKTMLVARLILGIVESPFYPGALYMLSMFYTRKEIATRMSVFYTGNMAASAFSGLISAPIFAGLGGVRGLAGWQWLFIIQGSLSTVIAIAGFFLLPDAPLKTRWLTPEERQLAHDRIARDTTERSEAGTSVMKGLREALVDYRTWIFCLCDNLHLSANGFKNFLPTVVKNLGLDTTTALVLTCPPYIFAAFLSIAVSYSSGRFNERTWHITLSKVVAIAGFAISMATLNTAARYVGIMLFVGATYGVNNIILSWTSSVLGQSDEKKAVAIAMCNMFGNLSSVYTPYLWPDSDAPQFIKAMSGAIGFSAGVIICAWVLKISLMRLNKKMRRDDPSASNFYVY